MSAERMYRKKNLISKALKRSFSETCLRVLLQLVLEDWGALWQPHRGKQL